MRNVALHWQRVVAPQFAGAEGGSEAESCGAGRFPLRGEVDDLETQARLHSISSQSLIFRTPRFCFAPSCYRARHLVRRCFPNISAYCFAAPLAAVRDRQRRCFICVWSTPKG